MHPNLWWDFGKPFDAAAIGENFVIGGSLKIKLAGFLEYWRVSISGESEWVVNMSKIGFYAFLDVWGFGAIANLMSQTEWNAKL